MAPSCLGRHSAQFEYQQYHNNLYLQDISYLIDLPFIAKRI